jgi:CubicO group peptidase (beta-lactamase class C family)
MSVEGVCPRQFAKVRQAFDEALKARGAGGAAFALVIDDDLIVDLWGGARDAAGTQPWHKDTLVNVFSATKGVTGICFAMLVDRGVLAYSDKVSKYWPEFAANDKENITVEMLLSHQAGLCGLRETTKIEDFYDQERIARRLATTEPFWKPGTRSGYHSLTFGPLTNELFRRAEGRAIGRFIREEIAVPFGMDIAIGLNDEQRARAAETLVPASYEFSDVVGEAGNPYQQAAFSNPSLNPLVTNTVEWRRAEIPSANGFCTATGLAQLYGILASGGLWKGESVMRRSTIAAAGAMRISGDDVVLGRHRQWAAGFVCNTQNVFGPNEAAFGHPGWGGSVAFADPIANCSVAYTTNAMDMVISGDPRSLSLINAVYQSI